MSQTHQNPPPASEPTREELLRVASEAAKLAGKKLKESFGNEIQINEKVAHDIKIELDNECQKIIGEHILQSFPDHAILGEEGQQGNQLHSYVWIVDPIDGTVNYTYSIPHFCVSIACQLETSTQVGVIYDPMRDEEFTAVIGGGSKMNGKKITVSNRNELSDSILSLGFSKSREAIDKCLELYNFYGPRIRKARAMGSAALDLAYIAAGRLDGFIESQLRIWDLAAGKLLIEEAGGKVVLKHREEKYTYSICAWNGKFELPLV